MNNNEELENLEKKREDIKRDFSLADDIVGTATPLIKAIEKAGGIK